MKIGFCHTSCGNSSRLNYLCNNLKQLNCEVTIYRAGDSIFDYFDLFKPQYFVAPAATLDDSIINYFKLSKGIDTKLILDISYINSNDCETLINFLKNGTVNIPIAFLMSNQNKPEYKNQNFKFLHLPECHDNNIMKTDNKIYDIDFAVFINKQAEKKIYEPSCHFFAHSFSAQHCTDINFKYIDKVTLLRNYKTAIFRSFPNNVLSQMFFDSVMSNVKVYYDIDNDDDRNAVQDKINAVFQKEFILDYNANNKVEDFSEIQSIIKQKHTSINRTKTFISQLKEGYELLQGFDKAFGGEQ